MWFFHAALQSVMNMKRRCKRCGKTQLVRLVDKNKTVSCKQCGGELPPPKDHAGSD
jgi:rRNA maturation endonuclease Nob1